MSGADGTFLVRSSSYRSNDHYQRQRVLQKERAIVSGEARPGRRGSPVPRAHLAAAAALAPRVTFSLSDTGREKGGLHWEDTWPHDSVRAETKILCFWRD